MVLFQFCVMYCFSLYCLDTVFVERPHLLVYFWPIQQTNLTMGNCFQHKMQAFHLWLYYYTKILSIYRVRKCSLLFYFTILW